MDFEKEKDSQHDKRDSKHTSPRLIDSGVKFNMHYKSPDESQDNKQIDGYTPPRLIDSGQKFNMVCNLPTESKSTKEVDGYSPRKLIDSGEKGDIHYKMSSDDKKNVSHAENSEVKSNINEKMDAGKEETSNKTRSSKDNEKVVAPESFEYKMFKKVMNRYDFRVWHGEVLVYGDGLGTFERLNENELKALIRCGWDEKIQAKLNRNLMAEIVERIRTEPSTQVDDDYFNCYSHLLNFWNGVLNLETGEFSKHSPEYRFTFCIQANYIKNPPGGKNFKKFLKSSLQNNPQKEIHLQQIMGYMLSEYHCAKKVPMIIGEKHSGKSTLNRILTALISSKHVSHVPLHRLHERFILAHLSTKKANICSEIGDEPITNIDAFKAISGKDEMVAEYKGKDHFTYRSKIKLMFSGNNEPALRNRDVTSAFYDRITFLKFNYTIPESERDVNLEEKILENDRSYIVAWAIEGLRMLVENNFVFSESDEAIEHKKRYVIEQNNTIDFIKSNCEFSTGNRIHLKTLYDEYTRYCYENCFRAYSKEEFFAEISKHRVEKKKFRLDGSKALWGFVGLTLKNILH